MEPPVTRPQPPGWLERGHQHDLPGNHAGAFKVISLTVGCAVGSHSASLEDKVS
jgi:hypothetical protein